MIYVVLDPVPLRSCMIEGAMKMKIAVASGKGGTGKTTVATSLARLASDNGYSTVYLDCDVEAPNGHLLLKPVIDRRELVKRMIPYVESARCNLCGDCGSACQFGAVVKLGDRIKVYPKLCKSCGACIHACSRGAISEVEQTVGYVEIGVSGELRFIQGQLDIGQPRAIPVIEAVRNLLPEDSKLALIDVPPGTSCPMVSAVRGVDFVLLVTDATPFGLSDLQMAVQAVQSLNLPVGVVVNRSGLGDHSVYSYCRAKYLDVMAELPYSVSVATSYARGDLKAVLEEHDALLSQLLESLLSRVERCLS